MKHKSILKILYGLLLIAMLVICFCVVMAVKNRGMQTDESQPGLMADDSMMSHDASGKEVTDKPFGCEFDSFVTGSEQIKETEMQIGQIPVITYFTDVYEEKPLLILQHGLSSKKEDMKDLALNLAGLGYVVVTADAAGHGELKSSDAMSLADLTENTAQNYGKIISYFENSTYVEIERTGIMGFSLGGLAAFYYTANGEYQPKVVVTLCATPDFADLVDSPAVYEFFKDGKEQISKDEEERKKLIELVQSKSPYEKLLQKGEICFYMLCGDADEIVPHEGNIRFYEDMKEKAKDITLSVKENQKHEVKQEDYIAILEYLKGHL